MSPEIYLTMEAPVNYGATNNNVDTKPSSAAASGPYDYPYSHNPPTSSSAAAASLGDIQPEVRNAKTPTPEVGTMNAQMRNRRDMNMLDTLCVVGFGLGLVGFLCTFHLKYLPRIPYPLIKNLQDADPTMMATGLWQDGINIVPVIWGLRYIRKIGLTLFNFSCLASPDETEATGSGLQPDPEVAVPRAEPEVQGCCAAHNPYWPGYIAPVVAYHLILGIWVGLATNYHIPYSVSDIEWLIVGLVLYISGEVTIIVRMCLARRTLVKNKREKERQDANTSSDHLRPGSPPGPPPGRPPVRLIEVGEVLSCLGFAVYTLTLPSCIMALVRIIIAIPAFLGKVHGKAF